MAINWNSFVTRKFVAAMATGAMIAACWVLSNWLKVAADNYGTLVTGLLGALSFYTAGNVAQDHVLTRNGVKGVLSQLAHSVEISPDPSKPA